MKFAILLGLIAACSGATPASEDRPSIPVLYVGAATDEALTRMLALTAREETAKRLPIDSPAPGASFSASEPFTFSFRQATATLRVPEHNRRTEEVRHPLRSALAWLNPIGVAHAHGAPFNGVGYYLVVSDAAQQQKLRIFTDRRFHTVEASVTTALRTAQQPLTLTLTSALFEQNEVTADGGPFLGGSVVFRVE